METCITRVRQLAFAANDLKKSYGQKAAFALRAVRNE
jgi:hypothetical protein